MSAKRMFEQLGFKFYFYEKPFAVAYFNKELDMKIIFYEEYYTITCYGRCVISSKLHNAIHKQTLELEYDNYA